MTQQRVLISNEYWGEGDGVDDYEVVAVTEYHGINVITFHDVLTDTYCAISETGDYFIGFMSQPQV
ncbi:MAG: hypothetical protein P4L79_10170 [Legionella sp.]|uniref:hypothetical protein n=1 Tax=Legionella sp. TaxID=459 RepID=UPI002851540D|nr:hypothetical protein [Legionella sp.]